MQTITIPTKQYEILSREADLYRKVLSKGKKGYPIELYSDKQIREFVDQDTISARLQRKLRKVIDRK